MTLVDEDRRRRILTDLNATLLVEAAAGTGKTSLMAGRVAMLLASGREPGHIAAITFTELAASELAHRIRLTVEELLRGDIPKVLSSALPNGLNQQQRLALVGAAHRLDQLTTATIHGFCQAMIGSYAVEANLDPGARIIDAPSADAMFNEVFSQWLINRLSGEEEPDDPVNVLSKDDPLKVVALIKELAELRRKHPTARAVPVRFDGRPDIDFVQAVDELARWFASSPGDGRTGELVEDLRTLSAFYTGVFKSRPSFANLWTFAHPPRVAAMKWQSNELQPYHRKTAWKNAFGAERGEHLNAEAEARFDRVDLTYRNLLGYISRALIASMSDTLDTILAEYGARKRAAAALDFDDLLLLARDLVTGHEAVRQELGQHYQYICVDEFQDTDQVQAEILFFVAAEKRPERWQEARLKPSALFLVGDPKQAIYRFRGADIEAYNQARAIVANQDRGEIVQVTANFRSKRKIVDHVNAWFEPIFSRTDQPEYVALSHTIESSDQDLPSTMKLTVDVPPRSSSNTQRDAEAKAVAQVCRRLVGAVQVVRSRGSASALRPGDIALLAPTGTDLWRYERALEDEGLSVASQAGKALLRRQEAQDVLALLRLLADPFDTLAFGAFMRGPLVGLTDDELLDITEAIPASEGVDRRAFTSLTDPNHVTHSMARTVLENLQYLRRRAAVTTPTLLLSEAVERLHIRMLLAARYTNRNARALTNVDTLIEMARPYAVAGLQAFVSDLQRDWEKQTPLTEGRSDTSDDAIEIITVHSSKGLEWPVVIPINTATLFRSPPQFVHRRSDDTLHWILAGVPPPDLEAARLEESVSEARERERMWYVACTRARDILIVPNLPSAESRSWSRILGSDHKDLPEFDLGLLSSVASEQTTATINLQTAERFADEHANVLLSSSPILWHRPSDHDPDRAATPAEIAIATDDPEERVEPVGAGRLRGIVLHKLMEEFLTRELSDDISAAQERAKLLLNQLVALDTKSESDLPDPTEMASAAIRTLRHPEIAALRSLLVPEVAVWSAEGDTYLSGRADALAVEDGQITVVLDWKSDVSPTPSEHAGYLGQIAEYVSVTGARRGAIVYMTQGQVVWLNNGTE
ncbi:UvrD-helicase domain-containing protein [Phyllobacterium chamaecytisi]|uniref:UvrD-helicase domain-containing protein n=1 Tax=Phyllobacterium chamaecytisi TaxID=2876082 RepID=UPI001CCE90E4|nr:UvrD-helicase domain-containing protein [Phyllobacterium sp. KW56]MBZ9605047.1 UvrD-helicase domain-containing protein [Phyllobacterium sp. KW56]